MTLNTISLALLVPGALLLLVALWPASLWRSVLIVIGVVLVGSGGAVRAYVPSPAPTPGPGPSPIVPVGQFSEQVRKSFGGPKAEGQIIGALFDGLGFALDNDGSVDANLDGTIDPPVFTDSFKLGRSLSHLQKARVGNVTPWGNKYPAFEQAISAEIVRRGIDIAVAKPVDANTRHGFATLCHEVGAAFAE